MKTLTTIAATLLVAGFALNATAQTVEPGFRSLFNGRDLSGWSGKPEFWSVKDGAITGQTTPDNPTRGNTFIIATQDGKPLEVADFELRFAYKFTGNSGNSGVQYRSVDMGNFVVHGYQADFEVGPNYSGILYEEGGGNRGILAQRGQQVVIKADPADPAKHRAEVVGSVGNSKEIQAAIKAGDWNDYVVIAKGNHLQHFINGKLTVDVVDEHAAKAAKSGVLAFQLHAGPPMQIQFKDIRIKTLN